MVPSEDSVSHAAAALPGSVPVMIVGGGPSGLLQALLLSRLGGPKVARGFLILNHSLKIVRSLIIERYPERLTAPKAHAINPRSLEILRQFGLGEARIRKLGTPRKDAYWVNFVTNLSGDAVGRLPYERMEPAVLDNTPEMIHNIPQPVLERELTENVAQDPNIALFKGFSIHGIEQTDNHVLAAVHESSTGRLHSVLCRHLVACDGHKSRVRGLLGIMSGGEESDETMMTIHFNANLRPVVGDRTGMLFWIMDPNAAGFIIGYDLDGTQVHISQVDTNKQPIESWTDDLCRAKIQAAIGQETPFDILSVRPWLFRRQIAQTFQKGNIFLVGDAAHSFPPTGGLGLNCGIADAHNLAYKLAFIQHNVAGASILSTYTSERRSVADTYSRQSVKNGQQIFTLLRSLNTAGVDDPDQARRNMMITLADPVQRRKIDDGIKGQREHFDNLGLHIGYVYGAIEPPHDASYYSPKFRPGARLPHDWISFPSQLSKASETTRSLLPSAPIDVSYVTELDEKQNEERRWSTLDLCAPDAFTFILGARDIPLRSDVAQVQKYCEAKNLRLNIWHLGTDFELRSQKWFSMNLNRTGGILVRPDQHIMMVITDTTTGKDVISKIDGHLGWC